MIAVKLVIKQEDGEEHDRVCLIKDPSCDGRLDENFINQEIDSMLDDFGGWVEQYFI